METTVTSWIGNPPDGSRSPIATFALLGVLGDPAEPPFGLAAGLGVGTEHGRGSLAAHGGPRIEPPPAEGPVGDRGLHRAAGLGPVGAVAEAAPLGQLLDVGERAG